MPVIDRSLNYGRNVIEGFYRRIAPFESVLDIGAGSGDDLLAARKVCSSAELFAVESYLPNVERLQRVGIHTISANLESCSLPLDECSIDVVLSNQTLEHVKEIFWILHEVSRVLKVGGYLMIGVPNLASLHSRLMLLFGMQPTCLQNHSAHVRGYTRHDLLRLFERVFPGGYRLQGFGGSNFYPFPPVIAKPMARLMPNFAWSIFLLLQKTRPYTQEFLDHPVREQLETNFYLGQRSVERQHAG